MKKPNITTVIAIVILICIFGAMVLDMIATRARTDEDILGVELNYEWMDEFQITRTKYYPVAFEVYTGNPFTDTWETEGAEVKLKKGTWMIVVDYGDQDGFKYVIAKRKTNLYNSFRGAIYYPYGRVKQEEDTTK